tara:strand:+ start:76 stop:336 length:261 start_codon:yes stop_codon:yes gene_type:complete
MKKTLYILTGIAILFIIVFINININDKLSRHNNLMLCLEYINEGTSGLDALCMKEDIVQESDEEKKKQIEYELEKIESNFFYNLVR